MAKCDPIHFGGITADVFKNISRELEAKGFSLEGPSGVVNGPFGIKIQYDWDEINQSMTINVLDKSFFVSCNQIRDQLSGAMEKYVGRVA